MKITTLPSAMLVGTAAGAVLAIILILLHVLQIGQIPAVAALGAGIACYLLARKLEPASCDSESCCGGHNNGPRFLFLSGRIWALVFIVLAVILSAEGPRWTLLP